MSVLTLADAKTYLNITDSGTDAELQTFINSAEAVLAKRVGPLASTTVTTVVMGNTNGNLILPTVPVVSITSITPKYSGSTALDLTNIVVLPSGLVTYLGQVGYFGYWAYDVVYQAGRASVPDDLLMGIKELVRHLWNNSQRGSAPRLGGDSTGQAAWLLPNVVAELISPYMAPGFA